MNPDSDPHYMLEVDPDPSEVELQLIRIKTFYSEPSVYHCALYAKSYMGGFDCVVTFRDSANGPKDITTHGETPEEALCKMIDLIDSKFGKCSACGQYRKG